MKTNHVTSSSNNLLKKIRSLHERHARQKTGLFLIEGEKLVEESLRRGMALEAVVVPETYLDEMPPTLIAMLENTQVVLTVVPPSLFSTLMTTTTSCRILAIAPVMLAQLRAVLEGGATTIIWGENIQDPGNLGTIMRSALAFGADCLVLTSSVDPYNPKVVRAAMGALFDLPVVLSPLAAAKSTLAQFGFEIVAFSPEAKESVVDFEFATRAALLVGNEGQGLTTEAEKLADRTVSLPQLSTVESLNVSVAASIALYERMKRSKR